ncbi:aminotransferase class I/II-fold pyridoxal phosphate-dependent enzyme [Wenjunlia tyrosinilytica]|uniref:cysteine-S-conjugate beta-lyase n=1 Tax=Wenjunlia tyrosinilytica TaxID=1544741 RepID=A0A917ZWI0_9ACTN|nr:aminotransferase class I/II-fold pyridoxal phosphate-dependent enzyme [Wenjunlia tyrosinilytica]GGO95952.1 aminotransferase [Wenjunlia tyrosinilytica]
MDLPGFPALFAALRERSLHPALGYTLPGPRSRELAVAWYRERFGARIDPDWLVQLPFGPRSAIRFLLDALTAGGARRPPGPVLAPAPEYGGFAQVTRAAGLFYDAIALERGGPDGYRLPVEEFEARAARRGATAIVLSNPHNPTGRVWQADDIRRLAAAAAEQGAVLISDEVHSDLVHPGGAHPVAVHAVGEELAARTVTVHSVGKTFNVSGLADALLVVPSSELRARLVTAVESYGFFEGARVLGALAQDVAYEHGGPWVDRLVAHLRDNRDLAVDALGSIPGLVTCVPQASYLLWLDASALPVPPEGSTPAAALLDSCGLALQDGSVFGPEGEGFLRLNFALPRPRLREAVLRLSGCASGRMRPGADRS